MTEVVEKGRSPGAASRHAAPLRLAYLSCDFGVPIAGTAGKSVHVRETVHALRRAGHVVRVFSPVSSGDLPVAETVPFTGFARDVMDLVRLELTDPPHLHKELRALTYAEQAQRALVPILADFEPHVVYERYSLFSYAGVEVARRLGVPLVLEVNAPLALEQEAYRQLVLRRTASELERAILTSADAVVVVSAELREHARRLGVPPRRIALLPNGVDTERFRPSVSGSPVRARYGLDGKRVVGFVGSLKQWHDVDTVVAAVGRLARRDERIRLLVVGDGPGLERLRRSRARWLTCTGAVAHEHVPAFLSAIDVVVVPCAADGHSYFSPLKLYEAMAMARPIVGARSGQVAEVLGDGSVGVLYEPGDAGDLAECILELLASPDRGATLGRAARRRVVAAHTWDENARHIAALARRLLPTGRVP